MVNDEEVEDFGGLESVKPSAEGVGAGTDDQPAPLTGVGDGDPVATAALPEDTSVATASAAEDPAATSGPAQVAGYT
jgi:hypothetical protein